MASTRGVLGSASAPPDDDDLEDLIAKSPRGKARSNVEIESGGGGGDFLSVTPLGFIAGSCRLFCYQCPCLSKCVLTLLLMSSVALFTNYVFNPTKEIGIMGADYSAITSAYDLSLSKVDHWCIQGDNDSCKCEDPLEPNSRSEFRSWNAAHRSNVADVNLYRAVYGSPPATIDEATGKARPPIDVAFLGESVVEAMDGRWLGKRVVKALEAPAGREGPEKRKKPDIGKVFERLFRKDKGGPVEGVALGIAGDNTANVLWRLQHDEMPYDFNPKVWWLSLGMNDLTRMQCSEEIVVLGILRVVEEIRLRKPDAKIVINSLLPMVNYQPLTQQIKMADFADFKTDPSFSPREGVEVDRAMQKFFADRGGHGQRHLRSPDKKLKKHRGRRKFDDDDATEGKELEEAMERRKKILEAKDKYIRDRVFRDNEKYRPKKPLSPFLPMIKKHVLPPVWPSVHIINDKLKQFCENHESITFFDATPLFASDEGGGRHQLRSDLISPRGHPSELGFAVWEANIVGRLHKLLMEKGEKKVKDTPAPFFDEAEKEGEESEDPSEIEELSPVTMASDASADLAGDGDDGVGGSGAEDVSDGKESAPPPKVKQPARSAPVKEKKPRAKKRVPAKDAHLAEDSGDGAEDVSDRKESGQSPKVKQPRRSAPEEHEKRGKAKDERNRASKLKEGTEEEEEEEVPTDDKKKEKGKGERKRRSEDEKEKDDKEEEDAPAGEEDEEDEEDEEEEEDEEDEEEQYDDDDEEEQAEDDDEDDAEKE